LQFSDFAFQNPISKTISNREAPHKHRGAASARINERDPLRKKSERIPLLNKVFAATFSAR
jgi:hypothetical protein